jgi:hypothetical protein
VSREAPAIVIVERRIDPAELHRLVELYFGDMVKLVVDIRRQVAAVGGELHADAEQLLLAQGSAQADLWGANYYPGRGPGNRSMEIQETETRSTVQRIIHELIGRGEEPAP